MSSLVNDIIIPLVSVITGGDGYKNSLKWVITGFGRSRAITVAVEGGGRQLRPLHQNVVDLFIVAPLYS